MYVAIDIVFIINIASTTGDIDRSFASFLSKYIQVIKKVEFSKVKKAFMDDPSFSSSIPKDIEEKLLQSNDCMSFINALKPTHCNWLNVYILKEVAEKVDISMEVTELVSQFNQTIYSRKVKEITWQIPQFSTNYFTIIKVTWGKDLDDVIIKNLIDHQEGLASLLQIQKHSLVLQRIEPGIEMHWAIPNSLVDQAVKSLKSAQSINLDILKLKINDYQFTGSHQIIEEMSG